jgi:hypothetical protein
VCPILINLIFQKPSQPEFGLFEYCQLCREHSIGTRQRHSLPSVGKNHSANKQNTPKLEKTVIKEKLKLGAQVYLGFSGWTTLNLAILKSDLETFTPFDWKKVSSDLIQLTIKFILSHYFPPIRGNTCFWKRILLGSLVATFGQKEN